MKTEITKVQKKQKFNAVMQTGPRKGEIAVGCPCVCTETTRNGHYRNINAIDATGHDRIFTPLDFKFFEAN